MVDKIKQSLLKQKYKDEQVFVVPTPLVQDIPDLFNRSEIKDVFNHYDNLGKFIFRYDAEGNGTVQQIIPYVLIYNTETDKYFVSVRTSQSGEARLYDKISIGFGGHINPCDGAQDILFNGMLRELNEEIKIDAEITLENITFKGTIRNILSELNDHLGFVFVINVKEASIKETDKLIGQWMSPQELVNNYSKLEDWAKFIVDYMFTHDYKL